MLLRETIYLKQFLFTLNAVKCGSSTFRSAYGYLVTHLRSGAQPFRLKPWSWRGILQPTACQRSKALLREISSASVKDFATMDTEEATEDLHGKNGNQETTKSSSSVLTGSADEPIMSTSEDNQNNNSEGTSEEGNRGATKTEEMEAEEDPFAMLRQNIVTFEEEETLPGIGYCKKVSKKLEKKLLKKAKLLELKAAKVDEKKKTKTPRVNYFVAIQVTNPEIKEQVKLIQEKILSSPLPENLRAKARQILKGKTIHGKKKKKKGMKKLKLVDDPEDAHEPYEEEHLSREKEQTAEIFKDAMERLESLHFTLNVIALQNDDEIERAKQVMESCWAKHRTLMEENPIHLDIHGLDHFSNKVIYAKIKDQDHISKLQALAQDLKEEFIKSNIFHDDSPLKAHMTIAKMSRSKTLYRTKIRAFPSEIWSCSGIGDHYFGKQPVESLQLLAMFQDPETKYYKLISEYKIQSTDSTNDIGSTTE